MKGVITKDVFWPKTPKSKRELKEMIRKAAAKGYKDFATRTVRAVHGDSPDGDPPVEGYDNLGFVHDCKEDKPEGNTHNDVILFARQIPKPEGSGSRPEVRGCRKRRACRT